MLPDISDADISQDTEAPLSIVPELPLIEEEREESIYAQLIGVVGNVRKMQTKS